MAVFNSFTFDGINSLDNGVYITGEAVYNAPERAVEMVQIPGRNGDLAIDQGRYENIEVTYPAGVFANNQEEFAMKIREIRNILCSRFSYVVITDTYNPDEYRLGLYKSGLEVDFAAYHQAGEFQITFNCKPQRFLNSGQIPIGLYEEDILADHTLDPIVTDQGEEIGVKSMIESFDNPTPFESTPLIVAPGPGELRIGNQNIVIGGDGTLPIYIDSDMKEIYQINQSGAVISASDLVSFTPNAFPIIKPGENEISSSIGGIDIIPRWWIL